MDPHSGLGWPAKSTLDRSQHSAEQAEENQARLSAAIKTVLECIGEDPWRSGLAKTPERYAKALLWMTKGYEVRLSDVIANAIFDEQHDEMVIVRDIDIFSLCEHHLVPFTGKVSRFCLFRFSDNPTFGVRWLRLLTCNLFAFLTLARRSTSDTSQTDS